MPDRAALLIAVDSFFEAGPPIPYAASDTAELAKILPGAGYLPEKIHQLSGQRATKGVIESHFTRLSKLIGKVDSLLIFITTRGFSHQDRGYLVCADTILDDLPSTAIPIAAIFTTVNKIRCAEVVVLLDIDPLTLPGEIVPSGLVESELRQLFDNSPNCVGLTASANDGRSYESAEMRHGIWRGHLIEILGGKSSQGGSLTAARLYAMLAESVARSLRRAYQTTREQVPQLYGESKGEMVVAEIAAANDANADLLDPTRMKRISFRAQTTGRIRDLAGFHKSHKLPDRVNDWARKYLNRTARPDIQADLDTIFETVREHFGFKRKELEVSVQSDGFGFLHSPEFEYTLAVSLNPDDLSELLWQREVSQLTNPEVVRSKAFEAVFGQMFDQLRFDFAVPIDVAAFIDRIEDEPLEGVKVNVGSAAELAEISLVGFTGKVILKREALVIVGRTPSGTGLLDQFLAFLQKFRGLGEPMALPPGRG